jgi:hypothetical protein
MRSFSVSDAKVFESGGSSYDLVTPFQDAIAALSREWALSATVGGLSIFHYQGSLDATQLVGPVNGSRLESIQKSIWGDELDVVLATRNVILSRSMAYLPGWRATALNLTTHKSQALSVSRRGLILSTTVPAGRWQIHWHYHAPYIELGLVSSASSTLLWLFGAVFLMTGLLAKRRTKVDQ